MSIGYDIVSAALKTTTLAGARSVQSEIAACFGRRNERPLGDRYQNLGMLGSGGSFDLKLIEQVTNMQDAVIERHALIAWGSREQIPYESPFTAAADLFAEIDEETLSSMATIRFEESDGAPSRSKRLTAIFRDLGIGMTPQSICETAFKLGGSNKEDALYLQGAFGMGGALTYRNAEAIVIVTRKDPALLLEAESDRIAVAVVEWAQGTKGQTALYLVDRPWTGPGTLSEVWSCEASSYEEFDPGTHVALVSYRVEGIHRAFESDEKSFPSTLNTRLYRPVMPVLFNNETARGRNSRVRGLERKLESSEHRYATDSETLIFRHNGETYHLPVTYWMFPGSGPGNRRSVVAHDHAVLFLSNGQVHHHWSPDEFKNKTQFNKLKNRVLITIETDDLPISLRTALFTADRSSLVKADIALRLEEEVRAFIDGWDALREENLALIRQALTETFGEGSAAVGQRIGRAIEATGFALAGGVGGGGSNAGAGGQGRSGGGGGAAKPIELLTDPTYLTGPDRVISEAGKTVSRTYFINGPDDFLESRGSLYVDFSHPDLDATRDIAVGPLRAGRVRVQIAIPDSLQLGEHIVKLKIEDWFKASGGLGPRLDFVTVLEIVDSVPGKGSGSGQKPTTGVGDGGPHGGNNVALRWKGLDEENFTRRTVGTVDATPASVLADADPQNYGDLSALGDAPIPTITLNVEYSPLKKYLASRSKELETLERPRDRYAIGVGVSLLLLDRHIEELKSKGLELPDDAMLGAAQEAAARAVLAVMPAFDDIARQSGIDGS